MMSGTCDLQEVLKQESVETPSLGAEDGGKTDPYEQLPEDGWLIIFDKLRLVDQYACSKVCCAFEILLENRRSFILSSMTLPMLNWNYQTGKDPSKLKNRLLNTRLVCRSWKTGIDQLCEEVPQSFDGIYHRRKYHDPDGFLRYEFRRAEDVHEFLGKMLQKPDPKENPFVSRSVYFVDTGDRFGVTQQEIQDFWSSVLVLLPVYGKHVWTCHLGLSHLDLPLDVVHALLIRLIGGMPNLRDLHFTNCWEVAHQAYPLVPLPTLTHLVSFRSFKFDMSFVFGTLKRELIRAVIPLRIQRLGLPLDELVTDNDCIEIASNFRNLKYGEFFVTAEATLTQLQAMPWPLVQVSLNLNLNERLRGGVVTLSSLIGWLGKFGETLEVLELLLTRIGGGEDITRCLPPLCLPKLRKMCVQASGSVRVLSLDFLRELSQLQKLKVYQAQFEGLKEVDPEEVINFRGYAPHQMKKSNIWEMLPSLEYLQFEADKMTYYRTNSTDKDIRVV